MGASRFWKVWRIRAEARAMAGYCAGDEELESWVLKISGSAYAGEMTGIPSSSPTSIAKDMLPSAIMHVVGGDIRPIEFPIDKNNSAMSAGDGNKARPIEQRRSGGDSGGCGRCL
ncbi:UDP-glucosyl transferase 85A3 [Actinidia rufa]|uniref:UDP-glucosyl transferase 85A3 n=1 Tax=Actinidia rufa TaxID=165716 RepID=A0A7J0EBD3_9ERIC|nr:UDP-glucosyl transferase 85A3 [Actinidia rufa]